MALPPWKFWLPTLFAVVVLSFVAATSFSQARVYEMDRAASEIARDTAPSIEHLSSARHELWQLQLTAHDQLDAVSKGRPADTAAIETLDQHVDALVGAYLAHPHFNSDRELAAAILREEGGVDDVVYRYSNELKRGDVAAATATLNGDLTRSVRELNDAITGEIEAKAARSHALAERIQSLGTTSMVLAFGLDVVCIAIAIIGVFIFRRAMKGRADLAERHRRLLEDRASELEEFAGRVAHDIRSPLGTVGMALDFLTVSKDEAQRSTAVARARRAMSRVTRLVDGLLRFAIAGARPDPSSTTSLRNALDDLKPDIDSAAHEANVELTIEPAAAVDVACNAGVLTSMIGNLANNAIKYMGDSEIRRIAIRAYERGDAVRIEVEDTGPGLPPGFEERVFDPYVRGRRDGSGIGLGLATVRRMAEAHGGRVGVVSAVGTGSMFWFELPRARPSDAPESELAPGMMH